MPLIPHTVPPLEIKTLKSISPSRYYNLKLCPLQEVLSCSIPQLLPAPPVARLNSVIHRILELTAKGAINYEAALQDQWELEIETEHKKMRESWLDFHFVPLSSTIRDFDLKRLQCFHMASSLIRTKKITHSNQGGLHSEVKLESRDKNVAGRIDAVRRTANGDIQLIDYKAGKTENLFQDDGSLKPLYQVQMKLYAALFYETYNLWPSRLSLIDLNSVEYEISFTPDECLRLLFQASLDYETLNRSIQEKKTGTLANPSPSTCYFCKYRPACTSYLRLRRNTKEWPTDFWGTLTEKVLLPNGLYRISVTNGHRSVEIRGLNPERHKFLSETSKEVLVFNLCQDFSENYYLETPYTTIYLT